MTAEDLLRLVLEAIAPREPVDTTGVFNVRDFGAIGDGCTDDTEAVQAAIDAAEVAGGRVVVPPGIHLVTALTVNAPGVCISGMGRSRSVIKGSGSLPTLTAGGSIYLVVEDLGIQSVGGHCVVAGAKHVDQATFRSVSFFPLSDTGSAVYAGGGALGGFFDCTWDACTFMPSPTSTVPTLWIDGGANLFSSNRVERSRFQGGGTWCIKIGTTVPGAYNCANVFRAINFEVANHGGIHLAGTWGTQLDTVAFFDNDTAALSVSMIELDSAPGGSANFTTSIRNYFRDGGKLAGTAADIKVSGGYGTAPDLYVESAAGPSNGDGVIDLGASGRGTLVNLRRSWMKVRAGTSAFKHIDMDSGQVRTPSLWVGDTYGTLGFFGVPPVTKPNVCGSRGGNAALGSLLTALAQLGLIADSSTQQ